MKDWDQAKANLYADGPIGKRDIPRPIGFIITDWDGVPAHDTCFYPPYEAWIATNNKMANQTVTPVYTSNGVKL